MSHLCDCGCGLETPVATRTVTKCGLKKGKPIRFVPGHQNRRFDRDNLEQYGKRDASGCLLWMGGRDQDGYGRVSGLRVHRLTLEKKVGRRLGLDEHALHSCDVPACFEAEHLSVGTRKDNLEDSARKGRQAQKLTATDVIEIREAAASGEQQTRIAERYGLHYNTVWGIVHRTRWVWL